MKKIFVCFLSAVFILSTFSCGSDKPEKKFSVKKPPAGNLNDLKEKYKDKEFKNCDEFIVASEEMFEVYFKTIDKAIEGDESAKKDIEAFKDFSNNWKNDAEI
ncbi:MAG: hypothetical protein PHZ24_05945 [Bacteroidales bacterium]|nr:hypothetical protein [Bacteroidales bacterium]